MKISDIFEAYDRFMLFENFKQLSTSYDTLVKLSGPRNIGLFNENEQRIVKLFNKLDYGQAHSLTDVFKALVKHNVQLKQPEFQLNQQINLKDSGAWVGLFNRAHKAISSNNEETRMRGYDEWFSAQAGFESMINNTLNHIASQREYSDNADADLLYKGATLSISKLNNKAAACEFGSGTPWCISVKHEGNLFDKYNGKGDIYAITVNGRRFILIVSSRGAVIEFQVENNSNRIHTSQMAVNVLTHAGADPEELLTAAKKYMNIDLTVPSIVDTKTSTVNAIVRDDGLESGTTVVDVICLKSKIPVFMVKIVYSSNSLKIEAKSDNGTILLPNKVSIVTDVFKMCGVSDEAIEMMFKQTLQYVPFENQ